MDYIVSEISILFPMCLLTNVTCSSQYKTAMRHLLTVNSKSIHFHADAFDSQRSKFRWLYIQEF